MSHSEQNDNADGSDIRIAVVDDHEMFRAGVIATLQPDFDIVGQAGDVEGAIEMIAQTKPDVVLLACAWRRGWWRYGNPHPFAPALP